jgi:hypothetical protein
VVQSGDRLTLVLLIVDSDAIQPFTGRIPLISVKASFCGFGLIQINAEQIALKQASDRSSFRSQLRLRT